MSRVIVVHKDMALAVGVLVAVVFLVGLVTIGGWVVDLF